MRRMSRKVGGFTNSRSAIFSDAVSNCLLPFLSSLPTCASFNRMWLVHKLGIHSRVAIALSALWVLILVLFFAKLIAIIPMPAMAAIVMLLGMNMLKWEDIKPHLTNRSEAVVFLGSFLSVLFLDLFDAVVLGSIIAIAYAKWEQAHPRVSLQGNVLKIRGNIYYGSLPVIESMFHDAIKRVDNLVIDFSECYYIDPEGIRWLAGAKQRLNTTFVDRRSGEDRRQIERRKNGGADRKDEKAPRRRAKADRRQRAEF
jgi:SulP family sulfate permease